MERRRGYRNRFVFLALISLLLTSNVLATIQLPNRILFQSQTYATNFDPLDDYLRKYPERKPKINGSSGDLWRGYLATYEIVDDVLILKDVEIDSGFKQKDDGLYYRGWKSVLSDVVPGNKKLKIEWYTGLIVLGYGEVTYEEYDFLQTFEKYVILEVSEGRFLTSKKFGKNEFVAFRHRQFAAFKKTDEYRKLVGKMRIDGRKDADIDSIIKDHIISYSTKFLVG